MIRQRLLGLDFALRWRHLRELWADGLRVEGSAITIVKIRMIAPLSSQRIFLEKPLCRAMVPHDELTEKIVDLARGTETSRPL